MYSSVSDWCNIPYQIKKFTKRSSAGTKEFSGTLVDGLCFMQGKYQLITNAVGAEVVTSIQLYIDGSTAITVDDNIIYKGTERTILAIAPFNEDGQVSLWVVYLK